MDPALPGPQPRLAPLQHEGIRTVPSSVCDTEYVTKNTALKIVTGTRNYYQPLPIMYAIFGKIFMEIRKRSKLKVGLRMRGVVPKATVVQSNSFSDESDEPRPSSCTGTASAQLRRYSDDACRTTCAPAVREHEHTKLESKLDDAKTASIATRRHLAASRIPHMPPVLILRSAPPTTSTPSTAKRTTTRRMRFRQDARRRWGAICRVAETLLSSPYSPPFTAHSDANCRRRFTQRRRQRTINQRPFGSC